MISLTIDNKPVEVEEGKTILQAAKKVGVDIPTFCWHEKLKILGGCRVCLVEVEKVHKLMIACNTPVTQGMVVWTNTPKVIKARKGIIEFLLINHPLDCPTCDKGGECDLQEITFKYGTDRNRFVEEKRRYIIDQTSTFDDLKIGPQVIRNQNRCIYCLKCIRFLKEIAGEYDMGAFIRGWRSEINVLPAIPIANVYSGNTVEICPVGALTAKSWRYLIRPWTASQVKSVCPFCGDGCNLTLWARLNKLYRGTSRRNDKVDEGFICDKGRWGYDVVGNPERIKFPWVKKNGKLAESNWEEAYGLLISKLIEIKEKYGPKALAGFGSERATNEDNYIFQKFFRTILGSNNLDFRAKTKKVLSSPALFEYSQVYTMTNSIEGIEKAKTILIFGSDLNSEHPIISLRVRKSILREENGASLLIANPKKIKFSSMAEKEMIYNYGTEGFLINGLLKTIFDEKLISSKVSEKEIEGLKQSLENYPLSKVSELTGVREEKIKDFARKIAASESLMIFCGRWISDSLQAEAILKGFNNLLLTTGKWGEKYSGFNLLWENNNSQGVLDMGLLPDRLPGFVPVEDEVGRERLEKIWNSPIPKERGLNYNEILLGINAEKIKGLYIMGQDPVESFPDRGYIEDTLKKLDFLVVQDIFLTESAKLADVVLPAAAFAEKEGTFTNVERRVQKLCRALVPPGEAKSDWEIICELSTLMGHKQHYPSAFQITEEIAQVSPIYGGIKADRLDDCGIQWPCLNLNDPGTTELLPDNFLNKTSQLLPVDFEEVPVDDEYPFILLTGSLAHHSGKLTNKSSNLCSIVPEGFCQINPLDAEKLNLKTGEEVFVESPKGKIKIKVKTDECINPGTVFIPHNFMEIKVNALLDKDKLVDRVKLNRVG
ncbi:MAG: NADH-quinone oxidoreductase subunit NuoG [candidate division Zixibacteria bacterium]|nr:NADH-quinone oxidoreductase subunit NuoG [candidate division Zixibacteria bacterium]